MRTPFFACHAKAGQLVIKHGDGVDIYSETIANDEPMLCLGVDIHDESLIRDGALQWTRFLTRGGIRVLRTGMVRHCENSAV